MSSRAERSVAKDLGEHIAMETHVGVLEILPPFGRLDNIMGITTDKIKVTLWL
jgi:hypothetical protein